MTYSKNNHHMMNANSIDATPPLSSGQRKRSHACLHSHHTMRSSSGGGGGTNPERRQRGSDQSTQDVVDAPAMLPPSPASSLSSCVGPVKKMLIIIEENHYGIHSFLNQFESWFVITIISITGPDGFVHNADNEGTGWGFDITSDLITIEWVRFIN